jgi:acyl-CoA synthetase (NDP forming)
LDIANLTKIKKVSGPSALSEYDAKRLLRACGIPVVPEKIARNASEAVNRAHELGYPVVLKGMGQSLLHKTEMGLVYLGLSTDESVLAAAQKVENRAAEKLEGFLVQTHVTGSREWIAGLAHDPQFGPVVMFGAGGILTEAISDITFRLAPLSPKVAAEMIAEIKSSSLLDHFRGEKNVDRNQLVQILMALGKLSEEHPEIVEVDINPLITTPDGDIVAVDALIILDTKQKASSAMMPSLDPDTLRPFFYPKSIAFVGASANLGKWGHMLVANTKSGGYQGNVHLVNPKGGTIVGQQAYPSLADIQDPVDLAIVTIPAKHVISLIPQLAAKGIHHMLLITSGFSETDAVGKSLEKDLVTSAREAGIQILGPNTMGICNPHVSLNCTSLPVTPRAGTTALVSQSGNMGTQFLAFAEHQGIGIRGFCGSGNEAMTTIEDFLEAFESDELTKTVMLYIESVKDGRRFFETARRLGKIKPVILMKGGQSKAGIKAASSHTGALSTDARIFDAVCRQAGIVKVEQSMDLLDLAAAFSSLPLPKGNRVGIMTLGGGWGVVTADLCNAYDIDVPELSGNLIKQIDKLLPPYWSRSNPIDLVGEHNEALPLTIIEELLKWEECDAVINLGIMGRKHLVGLYIDAVRRSDPGYDDNFLNDIQATLNGFEELYVTKITKLMEAYHKPVIGVSLLTDAMDRTVYMVEDSPYRGIFYTTPERAVKTLARMVEYGRYRSGAEVTNKKS